MTTYSQSEKRLVIIITSLVTGIGFIDTTALNVALPFIQEDLNASAADAYWVMEVYLLGLSALLMAGGALGDSFGRRRPLIWGVALFGITSLGCALSTEAATLIAFRALQGIAAQGICRRVRCNFFHDGFARFLKGYLLYSIAGPLGQTTLPFQCQTKG